MRKAKEVRYDIDTNVKNAIGYIRVSTERQAEDDKYGVDVQRKAILDYAADNGYRIIDWKIDEISGAKDDRPALNEILYGYEVTNPPFDAVIVFKNDRFARDTKLYFYYLYTLEKKNVKLLSVEEHFEEGDEFANIYRSLLQFVAEQERKNITLRTSKGRAAKASSGGYAGGTYPYGYKVVDGALYINEDERPIVELVFAEHAKGTSRLATAKKLNEQGYKTRKGTDFLDTSVRSILANEPFYRGYYKYGDSDTYVRGTHEPLFKEETDR